MHAFPFLSSCNSLVCGCVLLCFFFFSPSPPCSMTCNSEVVCISLSASKRYEASSLAMTNSAYKAYSHDFPQGPL